jgi:hypothetical protein
MKLYTHNDVTYPSSSEYADGGLPINGNSERDATILPEEVIPLKSEEESCDVPLEDFYRAVDRPYYSYIVASQDTASQINPQMSFEWDVTVPVKKMRQVTIDDEPLDVIQDDETEFRSGPHRYNEWNSYLQSLEGALGKKGIFDGTFGEPEATAFGFHTHLCVGTAFLNQKHAHNFLVSLWNIVPVLIAFNRTSGRSIYCENLTEQKINELNRVMKDRATDGRSIKDFVFSLNDIVRDKYSSINLKHADFKPQGTIEMRLAQSPKNMIGAGSWIDFYMAVLKQAASEKSWLTINPYDVSAKNLYRLIEQYCGDNLLLKSRVADLFRYTVISWQQRDVLDYYKLDMPGVAPKPGSLADELTWAVQCDDLPRLKHAINKDPGAQDILTNTAVEGCNLLLYAGLLGNTQVFSYLSDHYHWGTEINILKDPDLRKIFPESTRAVLEKNFMGLSKNQVFDSLEQFHEKVQSTIGKITAPQMVGYLSSNIRKAIALGHEKNRVTHDDDFDFEQAVTESIDDQATLIDIARHADWVLAQIAAIKKIDDRSVLEEFCNDDVRMIRSAAYIRLGDSAILEKAAQYDNDPYLRMDVIQHVENQQVLIDIATHDDDLDVREIALNNIADRTSAIRVIEHETDTFKRQLLIQCVDDYEVVMHFLKHDPDDDLRRSMIQDLCDEKLLAYCAKHDPNPRNRQIAALSYSKILRSAPEKLFS